MKTSLIAVLLAVLIFQPEAEAAAPKQPNLLVILADDLGYGDVQCYNPQRGKIPTPHLDKLAAQGMRFTDGHSSSGVCSPSRYTLLTGRYHWRTRLLSGIVGTWGPPLIAPERMTIGTLAKQHGYRTAASWQMAPRLGLADHAGTTLALHRCCRRQECHASNHRRAKRRVAQRLFATNPRTGQPRVGSIPTSAPTCRTGRRFVSSRTTARWACRPSGCPPPSL